MRIFNGYFYYFRADMRVPYSDKEDWFVEDGIDTKEPINLFTKWFEEARNSSLIKEANAMCLATATR